MEIKHVCQSCGAVMAVHQHSNYQEVKDCLTTMRSLCDACASWPGCPLPPERTRRQERPTLFNQSGVNDGK
jgi:hypothetical protein